MKVNKTNVMAAAKHRAWRRPGNFLICAALLPVLLLAACGIPAASTPQHTEAAPSPTSSAAAPPVSPAPTDWHSGVHTDYSGLTPYTPPEENYTRLKAGPMLELQPSGDYGMLMPYVGASLYGDSGYLAFNLFGLVTVDGVIVTDPIYAEVYRGSYFNYGDYSSNTVPAYALIRLADEIDMDNPWDNQRYAACALDGSWITGYDYINIYFTDKVILAMRSSEKNDIDVYGYDGALLYNTTQLDVYRMLHQQSGYTFLNGYGDGLIAVALKGGRTAFIDALTGDTLYTGDMQAEAFYGGYARVTENGVIGFMGRDFKLAIQPQFQYADCFIDGRCVVQLMDNSYAVIDGSGDILFQTPYIISRWDRYIYGIYNGINATNYYDTDFNEIISDGGELMPMSNGWFFYTVPGGGIITNGREKYAVDGISSVGGVAGGLFYYYVNSTDIWSEGVKKLTGEDVIPPTENTGIYFVTSKKTGDVFIVMSSYSEYGTDQNFKILDSDGNTVLSGEGYATYDRELELFEVFGEHSFGYADLTGKFVFRISLLQYMPD